MRRNTGHYGHSFLRLIGLGEFKVDSLEIPIDGEEFSDLVDTLHKVGFANVADDKVTVVRFKDFPAWMEALDKVVEITNSGKVAKRLTALTRLAFSAAMLEQDDISFLEVESKDYSTVDTDRDFNNPMFLDGANVIRRGLLEKLITEGYAQFPAVTGPDKRAKKIRKLDKAGSFSGRIITSKGIIKGDFFVAKDDSVPADIIYHTENLKKELKTKNNKVFILMEAHPRHLERVAWLDEQTDSWMHWLFPQEEKEAALREYLALQLKDIEEGIFPRAFSDPEILGEEGDLIDQFQTAALKWVEAGMSIDQSIFLFMRITTGIVNVFTQPSRPWKGPGKKKLRVPVRCAVNSFVATDAWLAMAGYEEEATPRGMVWYHKPTDRMVLNDEDFAEAYNRHGGWDLDDMPMWVYRSIDGERKVICIRRPNGPGEYSIFTYRPGSYVPMWETADGIISFPEISSEGRPPFLEDLDITYSGMPSSSSTINPVYNLDTVIEAVKTAMMGKNVFGAWACAQMVFNRSTKSYRKNQLASTETIIDTCTQEPTTDGLAAIELDTKKTLTNLAINKVKVDKRLWERRIGELDPAITAYGGYIRGDYSKWWDSYFRIVDVFRDKLENIAQGAAKKVPAEVVRVGNNDYNRWAVELIKKYNKQTAAVGSIPVGPLRREYWSNLNDRMVHHFTTAYTTEERNLLLLAMARFCYTKKQGTGYKDTVLFGSNMNGETCMYELYIEALKSVM